MPAQPVGKAVKTGIDDPFCDVLVVQHIADPPAEFFFNNVTAGQLGPFFQKSRYIDHLRWNDGKKGILVDNTRIQGRRFNDDHGTVLHIPVVLFQTVTDLADHTDGKDSGIVFFNDGPVFFGQHIVEFVDVNAPDHGVSLVHHFQIALCRREMQGDNGGEGPVQKPGGQAVMLAQDHLIPDGILDRRLLQDGVFGEIEQHRRLQDRTLLLTVPAQAGGQGEGSIRFPPVDEEIAVPAQIFAVLLFGNHFKKVIHVQIIWNLFMIYLI